MRAAWLLVALAACDAYDTDIGPSPFLCGSAEPKCPMGYECMRDPSSGADVCTSTDTSMGGFMCADDSVIEPNDTLANAVMTPLDGMKQFMRGGLAICPANDADIFKIMIATANEDIEVLVDFQSGGATLKGAILNTGGVPIASAMPVDGMPQQVRAFSQNLPTGVYYAEVSGPRSGTPDENNYTITINISGP
jgi:hypothetical protein